MALQDRARAALGLAQGAKDLGEVEQRLDDLDRTGKLDLLVKELNDGGELDNPEVRAIIEGVRTKDSYLKVHSNRETLYSTGSFLSSLYTNLVDSVGKKELPPHDDPRTDIYLSKFWKREPLLAGAVYSMAAKMSTLSWKVIGKSSDAKYYSTIFSNALSMDGRDWGSFISASAQDFYTCNRGVFWGVDRTNPRMVSGVQIGDIEDLFSIDALQCAMTGASKKPVFYLSDVTGQNKFLRLGEFIHFSSLTSPREGHFGIGLCASYRAWRAAKLLMGLHDYDDEKLNNLPPEGVAAVSGLTMDEFQDAVALWKSVREKNQSVTFPQVLWLLGSNPNAKISVDLQGFSTLPESFDRRTVVEQYVNTLALVFGVDAREFWPISTSSLGTASESEIQHMKAKGKGPGEFVSIIERKLNAEMPEGTEFAFDTQDIGEDEKSAQIAKIWIEALLPLVTGGAPGGPAVSPSPKQTNGTEPAALDGEAENLTGAPSGTGSIISKNQFKRLLADRGVLPNYIVGDERVVVTDTGIAEKEYDPDDEIVMYRWKSVDGAGVLTRERLPVYEIISKAPNRSVTERPISRDETLEVPYAGLLGAKSAAVEVKSDGIVTWFKQVADEILESERNIKGKPIPFKEALRGDSVTRTAIIAELDRWRAHPILSRYAPTIEEQEQFLEKTLA